MRTVKYTSRFQRDYRREKSGVLGKKLDALLMDVVNLLAADKPLPCPGAMLITPSRVSGMITGTVTSALT
jgi:hypothetical protein